MQPLEGMALANKEYVAERYRRWKADPGSVGPESRAPWRDVRTGAAKW